MCERCNKSCYYDVLFIVYNTDGFESILGDYVRWRAPDIAPTDYITNAAELTTRITQIRIIRPNTKFTGPYECLT